MPFLLPNQQHQSTVCDELLCCNLCLDGNCSNGSPPVGQNSETVSMPSSENINPNKLKETSDNCQANQQHIEQSDNTDKQKEADDMSAMSWSQNNGTTASAASYFRPGTGYYESFGDVVKSAKKTSKLPVVLLLLCVLLLLFFLKVFKYFRLQRSEKSTNRME